VCCGPSPSGRTYRIAGLPQFVQPAVACAVWVAWSLAIYTSVTDRMGPDVRVAPVQPGLENATPGTLISAGDLHPGQIGQVAYTASKAAIAGMCLTMARDLGSLGIRVVAIAPSLFATGLTEGIPDEFAQVLTKDAAFPKRLGKPEEYAKLAVAIVENAMLNGQCLRLDGGQRFAPK
jgi:NAD(P)-dependent dehydrogenase (short-subunit alcohol dehydrogenase family)